MSYIKDITYITAPLNQRSAESLVYPFSLLEGPSEPSEPSEPSDPTNHPLRDIICVFLDEYPETVTAVGNFPHNIVRFYWIHADQTSSEWDALARLDTGLYVYYTATTDKRDSMRLFVSWLLPKLVAFAMTDEKREQCAAEKKQILDSCYL